MVSVFVHVCGSRGSQLGTAESERHKYRTGAADTASTPMSKSRTTFIMCSSLPWGPGTLVVFTLRGPVVILRYKFHLFPQFRGCRSTAQQFVPVIRSFWFCVLVLCVCILLLLFWSEVFELPQPQILPIFGIHARSNKGRPAHFSNPMPIQAPINK